MNKNITETGNAAIHCKTYGTKPDDVFDAELAAEMVKRTDKLNDTTIDLALRLKQARDFIAWSASHTRTSWLDWLEASGKVVSDVTMSRMAIERETRTVIALAKDARDFFNSPEYAQAHQRMAELVAMMERITVLKQNGSLDAFADFILKVTCK